MNVCDLRRRLRLQIATKARFQLWGAGGGANHPSRCCGWTHFGSTGAYGGYGATGATGSTGSTGSTGATGKKLLNKLLGSDNWDRVTSVTRKRIFYNNEHYFQAHHLFLDNMLNHITHFHDLY